MRPSLFSDKQIKATREAYPRTSSFELTRRAADYYFEQCSYAMAPASMATPGISSPPRPIAPVAAAAFAWVLVAPALAVAEASFSTPAVIPTGLYGMLLPVKVVVMAVLKAAPSADADTEITHDAEVVPARLQVSDTLAATLLTAEVPT